MKKNSSLFLTIAVAFMVIGIMLTCVKRKETGTIIEKNRSVEQVFDSNRDSLLSIPGVVGAGIAQLDDKPCIMVMVKRKSDISPEQIPQELDGYRVIIEETRQIESQDEP
jgi:hypothetical protein